MNAEPDLIDLFIAPLEAHNFTSYMVTGSVASIEYGEPRATLDIDLAISLPPREIQNLPKIFPEERYYLPPAEVLRAEIMRPTRGHFNIIHFASGLKADCYPSQSHPMHRWALLHRQRHTVRGIDVWFAPPEYVILWKLEFFREGAGEKHLRDIRGILAVSGETLNHTALQSAIADRNLQAEWQAVGSRD